jgi:hypothetical protein
VNKIKNSQVETPLKQTFWTLEKMEKCIDVLMDFVEQGYIQALNTLKATLDDWHIFIFINVYLVNVYI